MKAARSSARGGVFWILFAAMVLAILGAAFSLIGGVEGDIRMIGLWVVIGGGVPALLILLPVRADRDEG